MAAEAIEAKIMSHLNDKTCYPVSKSLFENINRIKKAKIPLILGRIAFVSPVFERNCPQNIDPNRL